MTVYVQYATKNQEYVFVKDVTILFCIEDFGKHRQWIERELESLVQTRNIFQDEVNKREQLNSIQTTLLCQIDEWQNDIRKKVDQSADEARKQVKDLLLEKLNGIEKELEELTKKIQTLQKAKNYLEKDIESIKQLFDVLREKFNQINHGSF